MINKKKKREGKKKGRKWGLFIIKNKLKLIDSKRLKKKKLSRKSIFLEKEDLVPNFCSKEGNLCSNKDLKKCLHISFFFFFCCC